LKDKEWGGREAKYVILDPVGYPFKSLYVEYPEVSDLNIFKHYAKEQWFGEAVRKGDYLFDRRMYPDFAFKVVDVEPPDSLIGESTIIMVNAKDEPLPEFKPKVRFSDVVGQEGAKRKCKLIQRLLKGGIDHSIWMPRNVLFYGPSGTGKTMMAKALASEAEVPLIPMKATQLIGEYVGDSARMIHNLYERAEELAPSIVFIDELDAIALDRRYQDIRGDVSETVNALLTEMDGLFERKGVCTIAATNRIEIIDPSVRSRFEEEIEFTLPNKAERKMILEKNIKTFPIPIGKDVELDMVVEKCEGLSGRDIVEKVLKTALHNALLEDRTEVSLKDFELALSRIKKTGSEPPKELFI
jgi:AAA family ATPase